MDRFFGPRVSFALMMVTSLGAFLLSDAGSFAVGALAAFCIGVGTSGEMDVAPYLLSRYFGLRSFSTLYGLVWTVHSTAAAVGPILMGRVFDATGSYEALLVQLALVTAAAATLMLAMPRYAALEPARPMPRAQSPEPTA
jgi:cyanate permease